MYLYFLLVIPDPFYIDIKGCETGLNCTIGLGVTGSLTCSLFGVRPEVDLTWKTFHGIQSSMIHFFEEKKQVSTDGVTFDITLTSKYKHKALTKEPLVLECAVAGSHAHLFEASRKVQAIFIDGKLVTIIQYIIKSCLNCTTEAFKTKGTMNYV